MESISFKRPYEIAISCAPILHSGDSPIDVDFTHLLESCSAKTYGIAAGQRRRCAS